MITKPYQSPVLGFEKARAARSKKAGEVRDAQDAAEIQTAARGRIEPGREYATSRAGHFSRGDILHELGPLCPLYIAPADGLSHQGARIVPQLGPRARERRHCTRQDAASLSASGRDARPATTWKYALRARFLLGERVHSYLSKGLEREGTVNLGRGPLCCRSRMGDPFFFLWTGDCRCGQARIRVFLGIFGEVWGLAGGLYGVDISHPN